MNMSRIFALVVAMFALGAGAAVAQGFPAKSVRIVVGFAPGGTTDLVSRILAQRLGEMWGPNVIVDNRTGASGMIAGAQRKQCDNERENAAHVHRSSSLFLCCPRRCSWL